jgi:hypothetical protein
MSRYEKPKWQTTRILCRTIERVYGSGNFDNAGDDIIYALRLISDYRTNTVTASIMT